MTTDFERDTAVVAIAAQRYRVCVGRAWWVRSGPNGGYCAAIILRAILASEADDTLIPRALHLQFLAPPCAGPAEVHTRVVRKTRSLSIIDATLVQSGRELIRATATSSRPRRGVCFQDLEMPKVAPAHLCPPVASWVPVNDRCLLRRAFGTGKPGARAVSGGWIRLAQPQSVGPVALAFLWDAWIPAPLMRAHTTPCRGAIATLEASIYFKRPVHPPMTPCKEPLLLRVEATTAESGFVEESSELWSPGGQLLVQSRQLALLR